MVITVGNVIACNFTWDEGTQQIKAVALETPIPPPNNFVFKSLTIKYDIE